ncbi:uncharacterized protein CIMG_12829 [Coccidioides immitis RS]|uniref:Uncharacterized protein n=1 Tax=Coccidioides immitis (strain RS) TaxID=246410 RepID=A0A0D8JTH2_COCIM|nr:uncharacterized protein CIMG_12829 [Coccidioides immitis RS]KJF60256.1 hypothetical protein CIMG_12829 [Coccidioides immitis RS]
MAKAASLLKSVVQALTTFSACKSQIKQALYAFRSEKITNIVKNFQGYKFKLRTRHKGPLYLSIMVLNGPGPDSLRSRRARVIRRERICIRRRDAVSCQQLGPGLREGFARPKARPDWLAETARQIAMSRPRWALSRGGI